MSPTLTVGGLELAYRDTGSSPAVLLVHGMAADLCVWDGLFSELSGGARMIAYDRRGYGSSQAPVPYQATTVAEQAADAVELLAALEVDSVLVGGSDLGALIALELARHVPERVTGLVLDEPPVLALAPTATEALSAQRAGLEDALRQGGPGAAVDRWLGAQADNERRLRAQGAAGAFFADYAGLASWPVTRRELRALRVPAEIVDSPTTAPHLLAAADALAELLPHAQRSHHGDLTAGVRRVLKRSATP